jgi:hypothetical protein
MAIPILKAKMGIAKGLNQSLDDNLLKLSYSPDCQNIDVSEGILSTRKGYDNVSFFSDGEADFICALGNTGNLDQSSTFVSIEVGGNRTFYRKKYRLTPLPEGYYFMPIVHSAYPPLNVPLRSVNYKIGVDDVVIIVSGSTPLKILWSATDSDYKVSALGGSPPHASHICLHRDRIWMAGVDSAPNTVYYSNAYDPEDWSTAGETGEITIESFDGDVITGIANLLDDVVIFKNNSVWRITGDIPSEYAVEQIYAVEGTQAPDSICSDGNRCFYAGNDGIYQYNGVEASPIVTKQINDIWSSFLPVSGGYDNVLKCYVMGDKLYCFNVYSNICIVYSIEEKTITYWTISATDFLVRGNTLFFIDGYFLYKYGIWIRDDNEYIDTYWITPESDMGYPNALKTLTDIYFTGWGTKSDTTAGAQVKITVYYNKKGTVKTKEKIVTLQTTRKLHNIRMYVTGRIFKFKFENVDGSAINLSGIEFVFELDED